MAIENNTSSTMSAATSAAKRPRVIAFTSGKGGVGKTSISVNLAIALARSGSKVCLFDADMGMANVNIMLGVTPAYTLEHLFTHERTIQEIVLSGPAGLDIVPGASGFARCVDLDEAQQQRLVDALAYLEPKYDYLIIDTSAGISSTVLHFVAAAQMAAVVITPEPTSLTDAFSLLKVLRRRGYKRAPQVVVNMAPNASKADKIYRRFEAAVRKYIGLPTEYLGSVWMDESIRSSIMLQRPVALFPESDPSCRSFYRLADRLDQAYGRGKIPNVSFATYWKKVVERSIKRKVEEQNRVLTSVQKEATQEAVCSDRVDPVDSTHSRLNDRRQDAGLNQDADSNPEKTPQSTAGTNDDNVLPLHHSSEDQWIDLRIKLNHFLQCDNTTPEQVTTLLSSCIFMYGDRLGAAASDLLHGLLQVIDPQELSKDHRDLIIQDLERLKLVPNKAVDEHTDGSQFVTQSTGGQLDASKLTVQKHRYDEKGFGSQAMLVERIRASSGRVSLESLLESIKYASLVDSSGQ